MLLPAALLAAGLATAASPSSGGTAPVPVVIDDAAELYESLAEEANEAISESQEKWREAYFAAREAGERPPARPTSPAVEYAPKFLAAAAKYEGKDAAVPFLSWVITTREVKAEDVTSAVEALAASHLASDSLTLCAPSFITLGQKIGDESAVRFFDAVRAKTGNATVKGWSTYARYYEVLSSAELDSKGFKAAHAETKELVDAAKDSALSSSYGRSVMSRIQFAIGKVAPDIEGIDLGGSEFKLSDYEGKIVFLDFWGDW